jgi:hypothetical protein
MQGPRKVREGRESSRGYTKPRALGGGCPGLGSGLEEENKNRMQRLQQSACQGRRASASRVATAGSLAQSKQSLLLRARFYGLEFRPCSLIEVGLQSPSARTASVQVLGRGASDGTFTRLLLCGSCTRAAAAAARYVEADGSAAERAEATRRLAATRVVVWRGSAATAVSAPGALTTSAASVTDCCAGGA